MFYIILYNEAIKLHSQFLSINLNKNAINFNKAIPPVYRFNYLILYRGALFRGNDAMRPKQFDCRWVRCAVVLLYSFHYPCHFAKYTHEMRSSTIEVQQWWRPSFQTESVDFAFIALSASTPSFHLKLQTTVSSLLSVKESANVSRE